VRKGKEGKGKKKFPQMTSWEKKRRGGPGRRLPQKLGLGSTQQPVSFRNYKGGGGFLFPSINEITGGDRKIKLSVIHFFR